MAAKHPEFPSPPGKGWTQQARRWRLTTSLTPEVAEVIGKAAESKGISPSTLATIILSEWAQDHE